MWQNGPDFHLHDRAALTAGGSSPLLILVHVVLYHPRHQHVNHF